MTSCKTALVRHHPLPCSRRVPPPHSLRDSGMRPQAQTLAWPCLSWGPTPCLWPQEGRDPRAIASPKPNKASPWSLLAFQSHHPLSSLIIKWPSGVEGLSQLLARVWAAVLACPPLTQGRTFCRLQVALAKRPFSCSHFFQEASSSSSSSSSSEFPFIEHLLHIGDGPQSF